MCFFNCPRGSCSYTHAKYYFRTMYVHTYCKISSNTHFYNTHVQNRGDVYQSRSCIVNASRFVTPEFSLRLRKIFPTYSTAFFTVLEFSNSPQCDDVYRAAHKITCILFISLSITKITFASHKLLRIYIACVFSFTHNKIISNIILQSLYGFTRLYSTMTVNLTWYLQRSIWCFVSCSFIRRLKISAQ